MIHPVIPVSMLVLAAPAALAAEEAPTLLAQLTIRERIIVRVPRVEAPMPLGRSAMATPIRWKEKKGPKCIAVNELAGAIVNKPGVVDLVLTGGRRVRAKIDGDCKPLDFYGGFYLRPSPDGKVCADRDGLRMRSGATCEIDVFRTLVAER